MKGKNVIRAGIVTVSAVVMLGGVAPASHANDQVCKHATVLGVPLVKNTCITLMDIVDGLPPGGNEIPLP